MEPIKWYNSYGVWRAVLPGCKIALVVSWEGGTRPKGSPEPAGYKVTVSGVTLKARPTSVSEGMGLAVALARKLLTTALVDLDRIEINAA